MIDIHKNCTNYINKIDPNKSLISKLYLDLKSGIGCSKIKDVFDCFKNNDKSTVDITNLNEKIKNYIKEQEQNPKNTTEQNLLLSKLLEEINENVLPDSDAVINEYYYRGGNIKIKKTAKKEILGKERCIYKMSGDRKEYLKHKGGLITVSEYRKLMKSKK